MRIKDKNRIILGNKKEKTIYIGLDMDGVIVDWVGGCCEVVDLDIQDKENRKKIANGVKIDKIKGISDEELWEKINEKGSEWWANLDILPWADKLVSTLQTVVGELFFLSSPSKNLETAKFCVPGKIEWLNKYYPNIPFVITYYKYLCASSKTILVDDSENKINKFKKAGGEVFLWPNQIKIEDEKIDIDETLEELVEKIRNIN